MTAKIEYALTLRLFLSNKKKIPNEFLSRFLRAGQDIAEMDDCGIDFQSLPVGLFRRKKNFCGKINPNTWADACERAQNGNLLYLTLYFPYSPPPGGLYEATTYCRIFFDSNKNILATIDLLDDPFALAKKDSILQKLRSAAIELAKASDHLVVYAYCDIGNDGLFPSMTLKTKHGNVEVFSTRRPVNFESKFPYLGLNEEIEMLGRANAKGEIKGIYWITLVPTPYYDQISKLPGVQRIKINDAYGLIELPGRPSSVDEDIKEKALSIISQTQRHK